MSDWDPHTIVRTVSAIHHALGTAICAQLLILFMLYPIFHNSQCPEDIHLYAAPEFYHAILNLIFSILLLKFYITGILPK